MGALGLRGMQGAPMVGDILRQYPFSGLRPDIAVVGFALSLAIGLLAGLVPALLAYRSKITDTLRQA
jgi:hypothetical protein